MLRSVVDLLGAADNGGTNSVEIIGIRVRGAGHFPGPDPIGVRLLGRRVAKLDEIGLGLEHEDRDLQIGPDPQVVRTLL